MNILFVIEALTVGGAEQVLITLANELSHEHQVSVLCLSQKGELAKNLSTNIQLIVLDKKIGLDLSLPKKINRVVSEIKPDVINSHLWVANLWTRLSLFFRTKPRIIITEHSRDDWKPWHYRQIDRCLSIRHKTLVAVSEDIANYYRDLKLFHSPIHVIHNGIQTALYQQGDADKIRHELQLSPQSILIGSVGRLAPEKNQARLIKAFSKLKVRLPESKLILVGDGSEKKHLMALSKELNVDDDTLFLGQRVDTADLLAAFDVFVLSSNREGFPMTALEAQTAGTPVVLTDVGGNREAILKHEDGSLAAGLICVPSSDALAESLLCILKDKEKLKQKADFAHKNAPHEFEASLMAMRYLSQFSA